MDNHNATELTPVLANKADQTLDTGQQETWLIMSVQADCSDRGTEACSVWGCGLAEVVAASRAAALGIRDSSLGRGPEASGKVCVCRVVVVVGWQLDKHHTFGVGAEGLPLAHTCSPRGTVCSTAMQKMEWDREESWLSAVAPTTRCLLPAWSNHMVYVRTYAKASLGIEHRG